MHVASHLRILAAIDANGGVLTPEDAKAAGVGRSALRRAADAGLIDRVARGRYARPGVDLSPQRLSALHLPDGAVLSHRGAAAFYGLDAIPSGSTGWSIPHSRRTKEPGVYQRRRFDELDVVEVDGVLVTSVPQTLSDLGFVVDIDLVERAAESAIRLKLASDDELRRFAAHGAVGRPGSPTLRAVMRRRPPGARPTGSDVETICLQVMRRGGVPEPTRQLDIWDGPEFLGTVDFGWDPTPLCLEVDGFATHGTPMALQYDLTRANRITDAGYELRRVTYWDVIDRPKYVCRRVLKGLEIARRREPIRVRDRD